MALPLVNHNLDRLPVGNQGLTVHSVNAFHALRGGVSLILDVEKYCKSLPQLKRGVFCDESKHQVLSSNYVVMFE